MSRAPTIAPRVLAFLKRQNASYCESCLIERLLIASRAAMRAALELNCFSVRIGVCPDCKTRKQVIASRSNSSDNVAA